MGFVYESFSYHDQIAISNLFSTPIDLVWWFDCTLIGFACNFLNSTGFIFAKENELEFAWFVHQNS